MNESLYTPRNDIRNPIRCETCSDGIAMGNNHHCHRCLDEFWGEVDPYAAEVIAAAQTRTDRWYDADEAIRLSRGVRDIEHRFEGVICRRLQAIIEAPLRAEEQARLIIEVDDVASTVYYDHLCKMTARVVHLLHTRLGRLLGAAFPPRIPKRPAVSNRVGFLR